MITLVKMLLARQTDVNQYDLYGFQHEFPLLLAAERGNSESVRLLIESSVRINEKDAESYSAAWEGHEKI